MLSVSDSTIKAFLTNSYLKKEVVLEVYGSYTFEMGKPKVFTNENIVAESLELEQHLCDGEGDFVGCVSSTLKISLHNDNNLRAKTFETNDGVKVYIKSPDNKFEDILLFTGYIYEYETSFMNKQLDLVCHDAFVIFLDEWRIHSTILGLFTNKDAITIRQILNAMDNEWSPILGFVGMNNLKNIDFAVYRTDIFGPSGNDYYNVIPESLTALELLKYICQLNGVYGVINNEGYIEFRKYNVNGTYGGTYPSETTYPSSDLFPGRFGSSGSGDYLYIPYSEFKSDAWGTKYETPVMGVKIMATSESKYDSYNYTVRTDIHSAEYSVEEYMVANMEPGEYVYTCTGREEREISPNVWGTFTTWAPDGSDLPGGGVINLYYVGDCKVGDSFTLKVDHKRRSVEIKGGQEAPGEDLGRIALKVMANPFLYNKEYTDKVDIAKRLYQQVNGFSYPKFEGVGLGLPFMEVGDFVNYYVCNRFTQRGPDNPNYETITCLIMSRVLKGIQHMTDTYKAEIYEQGHDEDFFPQTHYIDAMSGLSGNGSDSLNDNYTNDDQRNSDAENLGETLDNYDTAEVVDDKIKDAIGDASNIWNVETVNNFPTNPQKRTIYFIRGVTIVE